MKPDDPMRRSRRSSRLMRSSRSRRSRRPRGVGWSFRLGRPSGVDRPGNRSCSCMRYMSRSWHLTSMQLLRSKRKRSSSCSRRQSSICSMCLTKNEENQVLISTYSNILINSCYFINNILSVASVAKAWSSLSTPSIITSLVCQTTRHSSLWPLCLSFTTPELRLRPSGDSRSYQILPNWVSINLFMNANSVLISNCIKNKNCIENKN